MTDKPEECECCHYETAELNFYEDWHKHKIEWLCNVCANTHLPDFKLNPSFDASEHVAIMLHVTLCTNLILDAIKQKQPSLQETHHDRQTSCEAPGVIVQERVSPHRTG